MSETDYQVQCPHCKTFMDVSESWKGGNISCPVCGKEFAIAAEDEELLESETVENNDKKEATFPMSHYKKMNLNDLSSSVRQEYPWGQLYIRLLRVLALLLILAGTCFAGGIIRIPFYQRYQERAVLSQGISMLVQKQIDFQTCYEKIISVLLADHSKIAFLELSNDFGRIHGKFNGTLSSEADIQESMVTLREYDEQIRRLSEAMTGFFDARFSEIKEHGLPMAIRGARRLSVNLGEKVAFYEVDPQSELLELSRRLEFYRRDSRANSLGIAKELEQISLGLNFIKDVLNGDGRQQVVSGSSDQNSISSYTAEEREKLIQRLEILQQLVSIFQYCSCDRDSSGAFSWTLAQKQAELQEALERHQKQVSRLKDCFRQDLQSAIIKGILILISCVCGAFFVLVYADFLKAHFSMAEGIKIIAGKKMLVWVGGLFIGLMLFSGCSKSPEALLERDKSPEALFGRDQKFLIHSAVMRIFQKQIADNPGAFVFCKSGRELILLSQDTPAYDFGEGGDLSIVVFARRYHVIKVRYVATAATINAVTETTDKRYPYMANMSVQFQQSIGQSPVDGVWGMAGATITPENFSAKNPFEQREWLQKEMKKLLPEKFDYFIASENVPYVDVKDSLQHFNVAWNAARQRWELADRDASVREITALEDFRESAEFQRLQAGKLTAKVSQKEVDLWLCEPDYTVVKNFLEGKIPIGNEWKHRDAYIQTEKLKQALHEWESLSTSCTSEMWLKLVQILNQCPQASQYRTTVELCEKVFLQNLLSKYTKPSVDNIHEIKNLLTLVRTQPCCQCLNRKKLIEQCNRLLIPMEKKELQSQSMKREKQLQNLRKMALQAPQRPALIQNLLMAREQFPELSQDDELIKICDQLQELWQIYHHQADIADFLDGKNKKINGYVLFSPCHSCKGTGIKNCRSCKNTGICSKCHGTGRRKALLSIGKRSGKKYSLRDVAYDNETEESCPVHCIDCENRTKICLACHGKKGFLNRKALRAAVSMEAEKFVQRIDALSGQKGTMERARDF